MGGLGSGDGGARPTSKRQDTETTQNDVAIKLIHPEWANANSFRERFLEHVERTQYIEHPHIAAVLGSVSEGSWLGVVSEWVEGERLSGQFAGNGVSELRAMKMLRPIAEAIDTIHQHGVIHQHLSSRNIKIRPDGLPVLLDLGLAAYPAAIHDGASTDAPSVDTTWMAPEQAEEFLTNEISLSGFLDDKPPEVTSAANRYTFGLLSYELLTGQLPWADDSQPNRINVIKLTDQLRPLTDLNPKIRTRVSAWVMRLLSREPQHRPDQCIAALDGIAREALPEGDTAEPVKDEPSPV